MNQVSKAATEFLENLFESMGNTASFSVKEDEENSLITINIECKNKGTLIGKHGSTLNAIQYLTSIVSNKDAEKYYRIILDAENYREKRKESLEILARETAKRVIENKSYEELEPMNPLERRIVHIALENTENIETDSIGEYEERRVVISYLENNK